jgi:hypothetical protein
MDPGTDRGTNQSVVFSSALGNIVSLKLSANGDQLASGTVLSGIPSKDGGGVGTWTDIATQVKYGVIEDQTLGLTAPTFNEQQHTASQVIANKISLGSAGSKTMTVLREPMTADLWREIDKVMVDVPEVGINRLIARVISYTFDEGQSNQALTLDQFSADDPSLLSNRFKWGVLQTAAKFTAR